jgi:hypothetical protein
VRRSVLQSLLGIVGTSAFAFACSGPANVYPGQGQSYSAPVQGSAQTELIRSVLLERLPPDVVDRVLSSAKTVTCGKKERVPGTYALLIASGNVKKTTFTTIAGSLWELSAITEGTPPPSTSPSSSPTTGPTSTPKPTGPEYLYLGDYSTKKSGHGCAILIATVSHKRFQGDTYNAFGIGFPSVKAKYPRYKLISHGPLAVTISGLSATSGKGKATLKNTTGTTYDTGSISLVERIELP